MKYTGTGFSCGDRRQHAALGGAIELGDDQPGEAERLVEGLDLGQRVLAGVAVDHQQHLVRRARLGLLHHPPDLAQLLHQVKLGGQAAGGVDDHHVLAARAAGVDGVEAHGRRIAAFLADDLHGVAVGPDRELLARRGAEGVGCGQQHRGAFVGQVPGQLADGGRLAGPVDARHHDHGGLLGADHQRLFQRLEQLGEHLGEDVLDLHRPGRAGGGDLALDFLQQVLGRLHAGVGHQQRRLQLLVEVIVDLAAGEDLGDAGTGLAQPVAEPLHPALALRRHRGRRRNVHGLHQRAADEAAAGATAGGGAASGAAGGTATGAGRCLQGRLGSGWSRGGGGCRGWRGRRLSAKETEHRMRF